MAPVALRVRSIFILAISCTVVLVAFLLAQGQAPLCTGGSDHADGVVARFVSGKLPSGGEQDLAIWITAPAGAPKQIPPRAIAIVIDRSGSMSGDPIERTKLAAVKLLQSLRDDDSFTVIVYSNEAQTIVPLSRATEQARESARMEIARIFADGGTCISCGLESGERELATAPQQLRRIVLMSDGQANEGIADRGELVRLAGAIAARGTSISAAGVGLDFDEVTMTHIAETGHGNYYFIEDTTNLDAMLSRELDGLANTVATDVRLRLAPGAGVKIVEAYGYPMTDAGGGVVVIPVADLRAGETRKIVVRVALPSALGMQQLVGVRYDWQLLGSHGGDGFWLAGELTRDDAAIAASIDRTAAAASAEARSAAVLEQATQVYERQGYEAAQQVIQAHVQAIQASPALAPETKRALEQTETETLNDFAAAPSGAAAKPMKSAREKAYKLSR